MLTTRNTDGNRSTMTEILKKDGTSESMCVRENLKNAVHHAFGKLLTPIVQVLSTSSTTLDRTTMLNQDSRLIFLKQLIHKPELSKTYSSFQDLCLTEKASLATTSSTSKMATSFTLKTLSSTMVIQLLVCKTCTNKQEVTSRRYQTLPTHGNILRLLTQTSEETFLYGFSAKLVGRTQLKKLGFGTVTWSSQIF